MRFNISTLTIAALLAVGVTAFVFISVGESDNDVGYFGPGDKKSQPAEGQTPPPPAPVMRAADAAIQADVPIGTVMAWLKNYTNTPSLPSQWVECNGQALNLPGSPYDGATIPNLNGASNQVKRFLRGSMESGKTGGSEYHNHGLFLTRRPPEGGQVNVSAARNASNLPDYYEIVWIMRVL